MKIVGIISKHNYREKIVIDAEPFVMSKVRALFAKSTNGDRGIYTHRTLELTPNLYNYRDIHWIMDRFNFECDPNLLKEIKNKSKAYDKLYQDISKADQNFDYKTNPKDLRMSLELRDYQIGFHNMAQKMKRILLADKMGLGKTIASLSLILNKKRRVALIIVPPTLCTQWERVIKDVIPEATTHVIRGFKNYELPKVDILITSYNRLSKWEDVLCSINFKTIIADEIHELRHLETAKRQTAKSLSEQVEMFIGLSGTPIFNYGSEIWSVMDVISPNSLGDRQEFMYEWCDAWNKTVLEPSTLNSYLKMQGLMLRRTPEDVGLSFGDLTKTVCTIDADIKELQKVQEVAKMLSINILSGNINQVSDSEKELDWKLRQATGISKAKPTAEFVKMILEEEEKVVISVWHRDVYPILMKELKSFNPVMYSGSETVNQKDEALDKFINGDSRVFIISLRSGAGIDGLQHVCNTIVHAELDWSPHVMDQLNSRLDRDGQKHPVNAYYLTITDGSDPVIIQSLNVKRSQHDGLIEGKTVEAEVFDNQASENRFKDMARKYLESIGEEIPEGVQEEGIIKDIAEGIRNIKLPHTSEDEMQIALNDYLVNYFNHLKIEREYKIGKRSRLDFLISSKEKKVAIECKVTSYKKASVYRQVRRYIEEMELDALILVAPWNGISSFIVDETPVIVVDTSIKAL